ncbi:hypothetical protein N7537_001071 [Penicillium hordei]|uniref:Uncharacterized protein n=1 Tax=Penicillium hordei TaxID=40994 RepID=A0AAD6EGI2_9EURO|nr:uncharacterized protein N7537_001071 [Penicillium hordei]KAJ5615957.1 hypothetical protein N7537_001071 [Penicillium hordei]
MPWLTGTAVTAGGIGRIRFPVLTAAIVLVDFALLIPLTYLSSYAQRFGRFNVMIIATFICSVFTFALWLPSASNQAATLAFTVLFGFWSGTVVSLSLVCVAQISKTEDFGKRYGTLIAIPIAGELLKVQNSTRQDDYTGLWRERLELKVF